MNQIFESESGGVIYDCTEQHLDRSHLAPVLEPLARFVDEKVLGCDPASLSHPDETAISIPPIKVDPMTPKGWTTAGRAVGSRELGERVGGLRVYVKRPVRTTQLNTVPTTDEIRKGAEENRRALDLKTDRTGESGFASSVDKAAHVRVEGAPRSEIKIGKTRFVLPKDYRGPGSDKGGPGLT